MVQLSHPYMTTGKTIALTGQTFVGKVMSLVPELNTHPPRIINIGALQGSVFMWSCMDVRVGP